MTIKLNLIHYEWSDFVILDFNTNRLYRLGVENESATFNIDKNVIIINWDKWGAELFITYSYDYKYYSCSKSIFYHEEWEGICYIDSINKLILRDDSNDIGLFNTDNDNFVINWSKYDYLKYPDFAEFKKCVIETPIFQENNDKLELEITTEIVSLVKESDLQVINQQIKQENLNENKHVPVTVHDTSLDTSLDTSHDTSHDTLHDTLHDILHDTSLDRVHDTVTDTVTDTIQETHILNEIIEENNHLLYRKYKNDCHNKKIPNIIHFVFGFKPQIEEFDLYRYIAIKSAIDVNNPEKVYFYYFYEPYGYWWEKIKSFLILELVKPPTEIFGNKVSHYAHQADIIRLTKIIERGGIYLDIDTICLKSFSDLLDNDFVMGIQNNSDGTDSYGLCNAVMLSSPNSFFGMKWFETYKTFRSSGRDQNWDEHSVLMPLRLSKEYPEHIKILGTNSFFYPLWYDIKNILFNENIDLNEYKKIIGNNYCIHLWDTYSNDYLKTLNENIVFSKNTIYNIFCRKFLRNRISIVLLTYNRNDVTIRCLESYLKCLDKKYIEELIILDNNSNSNLTNYLKEFQNRNEKIKLILSDDNLGVCGGRMILFKEAIGDIIISIDSDAFLLNSCFFDRIISLLYDESNGIIGISGAYIKSWNFGTQIDIPDNDNNEYYVDHIAGCCQCFRRDLFNYGFGLDPYYGKFWVEDTDLSMQSLELNKSNIKINQSLYIDHHWGGSGKNFKELFKKNWDYFSSKWNGRVLEHLS